MSDRRVHAECDGFQIVRYERAGKWYVEPRGSRPRQRVDIVDAVDRAFTAEFLGGQIHIGKPGGGKFDYLVRLRRESASREGSQEAQT